MLMQQSVGEGLYTIAGSMHRTRKSEVGCRSTRAPVSPLFIYRALSFRQENCLYLVGKKKLSYNGLV